MNRTQNIFITCMLALLTVGGWTSCISEDLSKCPGNAPDPAPTEGLLQLALTYKMHNMQQRAEKVDLFAQQVRKVDVFVFDETDRLVSQITEQAQPAFAENYTKEITLPAGDYRFVVWGNQYPDETTHTCLAPQTPFGQSRLSLLALNSGTHIPMLTDSLFHGYTPQPVSVVAGKKQTVPIDLMKDRNDIRVVVRWHEKNHPETTCTRPEHAAALRAEIIDRNVVYDFSNQPLAEPKVTYEPGRFAKHYNLAFHGDAKPYPTEQPHLYVADFSALRLMLGNPDARLVLRKGGKVVYDRSLMELITKVEQYRTQEALDREDRYLIELEFECEHSSGTDPKPDPDPDPKPDPEGPWVAVSITINGWRFVDRPIEL